MPHYRAENGIALRPLGVRLLWLTFAIAIAIAGREDANASPITGATSSSHAVGNSVTGAPVIPSAGRAAMSGAAGDARLSANGGVASLPSRSSDAS